MIALTAQSAALISKGDPMDKPANDAALQFHITIRQYDGTLISLSGRYMDSIAAQQAGEDEGGLGCRVTVRPDIETSYLHGKARFPNALHKLASMEALDGWVSAANADKVSRAMSRSFASAMEAQLRQQDVADVIGRGV